MPAHRIAKAALFIFAACAACSRAGIQNGGANTTPAQIITQTESPGPAPVPGPTISPTPENAPDLTGEQINLLHLCASSGPFSESNAARIAGVEDAVAAINATGGIFNAQLELHFADTRGNLEDAQAAFSNLIEEFGEGPILLICDAVTERAMSGLVAENEIPMLSYGIYAPSGGYSFGVDASPEAHFVYFLQDLVANWEDRKPEGADNEVRVAVLGLSEENSGSYATQSTIAYAEQLGIPMVYMADMGTEADFNVYDLIFAARDANANVIFSDAHANGLAGILNALHELGLRDRFVVVAPNISFETELYSHLADPAYAGGLYITSALPWWTETENFGIQQALAQRAEDSPLEWGYLHMVGAVEVARAALQAAILEFGFDRLSPETAYAELNKFHGYPVLNGLFTVRYSISQRSLEMLRTYVIGEGGQLVPLGEFTSVPDF